jgi:predicted metal-dependent phosphotriesterase family hydrolase
VAKLKECASRGIRTIVDPTVLSLGRYILRVQITTTLADNPRRYFTGAQA